MKKILLSLAVIAAGFTAHSQVICAGVSPVSIEGNYNFTWADPGGGDWTTPDFLIPGTFVEDTLAIVDDGSTGTNPQGNPVSAEGCNPLVNGSDVTGKIAVIYRNTCEFGTKALNAQNAGAVGVIIINRDPEVVEMAGGNDGASISIPVVMITSTDGLTLTNEMANGPVVMFLGNKTGVFADDAGVTAATSLWSKTSGVPSQLAQDGSEFNIELATTVFNFGTSDQSSMTVTASVDGPSGNVYSEVITLPTILAGDSLDIANGASLSFPQFSLSSYPDGEYTLSYEVDLGTTDEYDSDNICSATFNVQDSIYAYTSFENGLPSTTSHNRALDGNNTFSQCILFDNPNGTRLGVEGLYFSASSNDTNGIAGEEMLLYAYRWEDVFTDVNDLALAFNNLNPVALGSYTYPSDLQDEMVYGAFNSSVGLEDNQRFLFCVQTVNPEVFLGFSDEIEYTRNRDFYAQPIGPMEDDGDYFRFFTGNEGMMPAIGAKLIDSSFVNINELGTIEGSAFPNPAKDIVTISIETSDDATVVVTDLSGKVVMSDVLSFANGNAVVDIADLESGLYVFNITLANGLNSQIRVTKK